jgi:hypothetical protein
MNSGFLVRERLGSVARQSELSSLLTKTTLLFTSMNHATYFFSPFFSPQLKKIEFDDNFSIFILPFAYSRANKYSFQQDRSTNQRLDTMNPQS